MFLTTKKVEPKVKFRYIDESSYTPFRGIASPLLVGSSLKGPERSATFIGTNIRKPRWWQFWRWHLISRYKRECLEAKEKFYSIFGSPN